MTAPTHAEGSWWSRIFARDRTKIRPLWILNPGRRRTDRWFTYLLIALLILESLFVLYTSVRQAQASSELDRTTNRQEQINDALIRQNAVLICYAQKSDAVDAAITRLATVQAQNPSSPEVNAALDAVRAAQADKEACGR
jgi:hypothetical protein